MTETTAVASCTSANKRICQYLVILLQERFAAGVAPADE